MRKVTFDILWEIFRYNSEGNPLKNYFNDFLKWSKEEGHYYWMQDAQALTGCGDLGIERVLGRAPFISDPVEGDILYLRDNLRETWLEYINGSDIIREEILRKYDNLADPRF